MTGWLDSRIAWQTLEPRTMPARLLHELLFHRLAPDMIPPPNTVSFAEYAPQSRPALRLIRVDHTGRTAYALIGPQFLRYVAGEPDDIYEANLRSPPELANGGAALDYLRLFVELTSARRQARLVESVADLTWLGLPDLLETAPASIAPVAITEPDAHGRREATLYVQGAGTISRLSFIIWADGLVQEGAATVILRHPLLATPALISPFAAMLRQSDEATSALVGTVDLEQVDASVTEAPSDHDADDESADFTDENESVGHTTLTEHFGRIAAVLLDAAIGANTSLKLGPAPQRVTNFIRYLADYRPTIAIETPYRDLSADFAELLAKRCNFRVDLSWQSPSNPRVALRSTPSVVLMTEATFGQPSESPESDASLLLAPVIRGPHIGLFVVDRIAALPLPARDIIDLAISIPRIDSKLFKAIVAALFDGAPSRLPARDWMRYVLPRDIVRSAAMARTQRAFLAEIEQTVTRRLAQYTAPESETPALADLHGLGEARIRMEELATDIRHAQHGEIGWDMVDRGYLLVGPPGTGKTTLVKALARECGVRFVLASAGAWQEGTSLGPHVQNIRRTFREARLYAPAILFIDELDSIGARANIEERNSQYQTVVINTLLEELQGFEGREGVVVIGATNNVDQIDPALRRPGRLDRTIMVPYPNVQALAQIFGVYLRRARHHGFNVGGLDLDRLARLSFGRTGAHVELFVRGALRRARRAGRKELTQADLVDEIVNMPPDGARHVLPPDALRRVAVHEAGHALANIAGSRQGQGLTWISITPRADGSLGFVAQMPNEQLCVTEADMAEEIRIVLGGRAAEEVMFGKTGVSGGAGGDGPSDLAMASHMVLRMLTQFGFSEASGLLWLDWQGGGNVSRLTAEAIRNLPLGEDLLAEARTNLHRLYGEVVARLAHGRARLDAIVALLIARQDVSAEDLIAALPPELVPAE